MGCEYSRTQACSFHCYSKPLRNEPTCQPRHFKIQRRIWRALIGFCSHLFGVYFVFGPLEYVYSVASPGRILPEYL
ncbi:hypothetical protein AHF37_09225 [Paragonimus kellicotti]|nr:hypothetical protein AHF37_09225 [Paragonimus kellicotti]